MKKTKIHDLRKSPNKKPKYPVEHMLTTEDVTGKDIDEYCNQISREKTWMDERKIERLGEEMVKWALEDPDAVILNKFFHDRGISSDVARKWRDKWPAFAHDYKQAKSIIGSRLFDGALKNKFDSGMVKFVMPMHDEDWKNETERVARLKIAQEQSEKSATFIIQKVDYKGIPIHETKKTEV